MSLMSRIRQLRDQRAVATQLIRRGIVEVAAGVDPGKIVLDVGAGRTPWRQLFEDHSGYVAFDVSRLPELDLMASATHVPICADVVDLVLCTEVLEHVRDTHAAMRELQRVVRPGGHLIVTTPLLWGVHDKVDFYRWTGDGLNVVLRDYGFETIKIVRRGGIFASLAVLLDQIPFQLLSGSPERFANMRMGEQLGFLAASGIQLAITPLVWFVTLFDRFDHVQRFTLGYVVLARKKQ